MERTQVQSSNVNSIGYDEESKTLEVEFHGGGVYQYSDVPKEVYEDFMNAPSHGKFLHKVIKSRFSYIRV